MKKYESVFILDIRKVEDDGTAFSEELKGMVEGQFKGKMVESKTMGRKQFAREIKKRKAGIYWNYIFEMEPEHVKALRSNFRLDERVLRLMTLIYDKPEK